MGCAASAPAVPAEPTAQELEAELHEVLIMEETVQPYELAMQAIRTELNSAKDAYRLELADETNRRLGSSSSRESRKDVVVKQERVHQLEKQLADLHADFTEAMAQLRIEQRRAVRGAEIEAAGESTTSARPTVAGQV